METLVAIKFGDFAQDHRIIEKRIFRSIIKSHLIIPLNIGLDIYLSCILAVCYFSSDYDDFLEDLEEDKDYRSAINIYKGEC